MSKSLKKSTKSDFVIWISDPHFPGACSLGDLQGYEEIFRLWKGEPQAASFPKDAKYTMSAKFPKDMVLTDCLLNTDNLKVISGKLRKFFENHGVNQTEYLPVTIRDHKNKVASSDYYILNTKHPVDCLDRVASKAKISPVNKTRVMSVKKLILKQSALPADRQVFRVADFPKIHLVQRDLAEAITAAQFTGIRWQEVSEYSEI